MGAVTPVNTPNHTQYFYPIDADNKWKLTALPMVASLAISDGCAIGIEISGNTTTGNYTKMPVENASGGDFAGILAEPIATTDSDYATAGKLKLVWVPNTPNAEAYFTVGAGTFSAVDVGKTVEFTSGSLGLSVDTAGKGARITGFITSTRGKCAFVMPNTETA